MLGFSLQIFILGTSKGKLPKALHEKLTEASSYSQADSNILYSIKCGKMLMGCNKKKWNVDIQALLAWQRAKTSPLEHTLQWPHKYERLSLELSRYHLI